MAQTVPERGPARGIRQAAGVVAVLLCDLQHYPQRRYCMSADGNDAACRARPDWCFATGGESCVGRDCPGRYCQVVSGACLVRPLPDADCPADPRFLHGNKVADLSRFAAWKRKAMSDRAWALSGRVVTRAVFDWLSDSDRRELCGTGPDNPCRLEWDDLSNNPACRLRADACVACTRHTEPYRCYPKKLCAGMLCL